MGSCLAISRGQMCAVLDTSSSIMCAPQSLYVFFRICNILGFLFEPSRRWLQHWFRHLCFEIRVRVAFEYVVDGSTLIWFLSFLNKSGVCNLIVICLPTVFFLVVSSRHHRVAFVEGMVLCCFSMSF